MHKDDGGPAFPSSNSPDTGFYAEGMTLRDYFAAKAMPLAMERLRRNYTRDQGDDWYWEEADWRFIAARAYDMADAMLAARKGDNDASE